MSNLFSLVYSKSVYILTTLEQFHGVILLVRTFSKSEGSGMSALQRRCFSSIYLNQVQLGPGATKWNYMSCMPSTLLDIKYIALK